VEWLKRRYMDFVMVLLIPLIVTAALCVMFQDRTIKEIPTAVYLGDNSALARKIAGYFDDSETFDIRYYASSPYEIEELIEKGDANFGLVIPEGFERDIKSQKQTTVLTVIDASRLAMASAAKIKAFEILMSVKAGALMQLLQAKLSLNSQQALHTALAVDMKSRLLYNELRDYKSFLMPGIMAGILQSGLAMAAAASRRSDKEGPRRVLTRIGYFWALGFSALAINIAMLAIVFGVPLRGSAAAIVVLSAAFALCVSAMGVAISCVVKNSLTCAQAAAVLFLPNTMLSGYTWPLGAMPHAYETAGRFIPYTRYAESLRDMMIKGESQSLHSDMLYLLLVACAVLAAALVFALKRPQGISGKLEIDTTKRSIAILTAGPIFFTLLFGGIYLNDYYNSIPFAVSDNDNSQLSRMIVSQFERSEKYELAGYADSPAELKSMLDSKKAHIGLYIPADFEKNVKALKSPTAAVIVDGSNIAVANNAQSKATEIISTISAGASIKAMEARGFTPDTALNLAKIINIESRNLYDPKLTYKMYMMPGFIVILVQQLFMSALTPKLLDRGRISFNAAGFSLLGALVYSVCMLLGRHALGMDFTGSIATASLYVFLMLLALSGVAAIIAFSFGDALRATQLCMMLSMPTFLTAGYVWPLEQIDPALKAVVGAVWPAIYAVSPIRDVLIKNAPLNQFTVELLSLLAFGLFWGAAGYYVSKRTGHIKKRKPSEQAAMEVGHE